MSTPPFPVTKSPGTFIIPSEPTPTGITLPLSPMDRVFPPGTFVEMILVFKQGDEGVVRKVRQALAKALVPYHPLAGRMVRSESGEMEVACTGDGVWFVEATAECSLQDLDGLAEPPLKIATKELVSYPENSAGLAVTLQITKFSCGGFVIGYVYDHAVADGVGMAQLMVAISDFARGLDTPTIQPIWSRDAIPVPPKLATSEPTPHGPPPPFPTGRNQYYHLDISSDRINELKSRFKNQTGQTWSTLEILSAVSWQARARAINLEPEADITIGIPANVRRHFVGTGYYGNCLYPLMVTVDSRKLIGASVVEVMNMIREVKGKLAILVENWTKGEEVRFGSNLIYMTDWSRLGFDGVDFGWGKPDYIAPLLDNHPGVVAYIVRSPTPMKGVRLITQCVMEENLATLQNEIMKAFDI